LDYDEEVDNNMEENDYTPIEVPRPRREPIRQEIVKAK